MKVGDFVKFKGENESEPGAAKGLLVEIRTTVGGTHGVMWDFLGGQIGWQREYELEVINESR
tara:strand:- start:7760 stop:7945 length:186 start_codon:yes stop_codon:yes gene_type:complete